MDERRRGAVCVGIGVLSLGLLILNDHWEPLREASPAAMRMQGDSDQATGNRATGDGEKQFFPWAASNATGWTRYYSGAIMRTTREGRREQRWQVVCYGLPTDGQQRERVLVHSREGHSVWQNSDLEPWKTGEWLGLLERSSHESRSQGEGRWVVVASSSPNENPLVDYGPLLEPAGQAGPGGWISNTGMRFTSREQQIHVQPAVTGGEISDSIAAQFCFRGTQWRLTEEERSEGLLRYVTDHRLSTLETATLTRAVDVWQRLLAEQQQGMLAGADGLVAASLQPCISGESLWAEQSAIKHVIEQVSHPLIRRVLQRRLVDVGFNRPRTLAAITEGNLLRSQGPMQWRFRDLQGAFHGAENHAGRFVVIGFAADERPETVAMLQSMAKLQRRRGNQEVVTYQVLPHDREVRQGLIDDFQAAGIVPLSDHGAANVFHLETVGMPALVVLDRRSCLMTLAAWQPEFPAEQLLSSIEQRIRLNSDESHAPLTSRPRGRDNPLAILAGLGVQPGGNQWNRVFWLGYGGALPYCLK
jgi:hypothetical protein